MNTKKLTVGIVLLSWLFAVGLKAQISGTNLLEYQNGEIPGDTVSTSGLYDRAIVNYRQDGIKASATIEQYHSQYEDRNYLRLSQYSVQYKTAPLEVKLGNFYETIGRGTLLRSFEVPGAILEDLSFRSRHYFHRDILGATVKYSNKNLTAKAIYGRPLNYVYPPNKPDNQRRPDIVEVLYADYSIKSHVVGASVMQLTNGGDKLQYGMVNASGNLGEYVSYFGELSRNVNEDDIGDFGNESSYAFYGSINVSIGTFGLSSEYKSYNNFLLGAGVNEPPALVKEHSSKLLNRSTHVLQPTNEKGYQFEAFYMFKDYSVLTLNHTRAINSFGKKFVFEEYFAGYDFSLFQQHDLKLYANYAEDPFKLEKQRITGGTDAQWKLSKAVSLKTVSEYQQFERLDKQVNNYHFVLGATINAKLTISATSEISNDNFVVENGSKHWLGGLVNYRVNNKNTMQLFVGERRGGPACNAGICYEVLDFKGVEFRLTSRF